MAAKITHLREVTHAPGVGLRWGEDLYRFTKRLVDVILSATLLVLLSPLMLAIAIAIRLDSPGPVLFRQEHLVRGSRVIPYNRVLG